jgi:FAD/FMN-containing dehydrogenase
LTRKRIHIGRRTGKIGFLGKGMTLPSREKSEVVSALALRIDEDLISLNEADLDRCRTDMPLVPGRMRSLFSRRPAAVVRPGSAKCVADVIDTCIEEKTVVVPRGGGTAGLGGATAVRGGVIIDVSGMNQVLGLDKERMCATVEAGCSWQALKHELAGAGLRLRSYPLSAPQSTVGGWMSTGGYGIGTLGAGCFHSQVEAMEVAVPSGLLVNAGPGDGRYAIGSLAGAEGQMGIITKLEVPVARMAERKCYRLLRLASDRDGAEVLKVLANTEKPPFALMMLNRSLSEALRDLNGLPTGGSPMIIVADEGDAGDADRLDGLLKEVAPAGRFELDDGEDARILWDARFSYLGARPGRTVLLTGEALVRPSDLHSLLEPEGSPSSRQSGLLHLCQVVDRDTVLVMTGLVREPVEGADLVRDVVRTSRFAASVAARGGRPYGIGLWNSRFARIVLGERFKNLKLIKSETDRIHILNPGKFFSLTTNTGWPVWGPFFNLILGLAGRP